MKMKEFLKENERCWADRAEGYCKVNIDELRSNKKLEWIDIINIPTHEFLLVRAEGSRYRMWTRIFLNNIIMCRL